MDTNIKSIIMYKKPLFFLRFEDLKIDLQWKMEEVVEQQQCYYFAKCKITKKCIINIKITDTNNR